MDAVFDQKRNNHFKALFGKIQAIEGSAGWKEIWFDIEIIDAVNDYFEEKNNRII